jgi:hypothetical protein
VITRCDCEKSWFNTTDFVSVAVYLMNFIGEMKSRI